MQKGIKGKGFFFYGRRLIFLTTTTKNLSFLRGFLKHKTMKYERKIKRIVFKIIDRLLRVGATWIGGGGRREGKKKEEGKKSKGREGREEEGKKTIVCVKRKIAEEIGCFQTSGPPASVGPSLALVAGPATPNSDQNPI